MTSAAIGWFSASTKALVAGTGDDRDDDVERDYGVVWEAGVIDVEIVAEGRRGVAEESESRRAVLARLPAQPRAVLLDTGR